MSDREIEKIKNEAKQELLEQFVWGFMAGLDTKTLQSIINTSPASRANMLCALAMNEHIYDVMQKQTDFAAIQKKLGTKGFSELASHYDINMKRMIGPLIQDVDKIVKAHTPGMLGIEK